MHETQDRRPESIIEQREKAVAKGIIGRHAIKFATEDGAIRERVIYVPKISVVDQILASGVRLEDL